MIIAYTRARRPVNPAPVSVNMIAFGFAPEGSGGSTPVVTPVQNAPFIANFGTLMNR